MSSQVDWIKQCIEHVRHVRDLADTNQFNWTSLPSPNPDALRAFQGENEHYLINVAQANISGHGVVHEGMVVCKEQNCVIRIDRDLANVLWHKAAATSN